MNYGYIIGNITEKLEKKFLGSLLDYQQHHQRHITLEMAWTYKVCLSHITFSLLMHKSLTRLNSDAGQCMALLGKSNFITADLTR
jgi:hypothetical protein